ncbi:MAG: hypothetical protein DRP01_04240, partial [Archaeoglobales archaeon]
DYTYTLYDTAEFGTTAGVTHTLFQVREGADSTHVAHFTNMRGPGALSSEERFVIEKIEVFPDPDFSVDDLQAMWKDSYLEVKGADKSVLKVPLALCAAAVGFMGHYTQASAADECLASLKGEGYKLPIPIEIPGATSFAVEVYQGTALSAANKSVKVCLTGTLTMP